MHGAESKASPVHKPHAESGARLWPQGPGPGCRTSPEASLPSGQWWRPLVLRWSRPGPAAPAWPPAAPPWAPGRRECGSACPLPLVLWFPQAAAGEDGHRPLHQVLPPQRHRLHAGLGAHRLPHRGLSAHLPRVHPPGRSVTPPRPGIVLGVPGEAYLGKLSARQPSWVRCGFGVGNAALSPHPRLSFRSQTA